MIFKCNHKFSDLVVYSDNTEKDNKDYVDYTDVTIHLYCTKCNTKLDLEYSKIKESPKFLESDKNSNNK